MLRSAYFVPESIKADQLFSDMQKKKVHIAIVIDEYGETRGIITLEDLLEEIVGNIYDEFDEAEAPEIEKLGDNRWRVSGTLSIEDLEEELDVDIPIVEAVVEKIVEPEGSGEDGRKDEQQKED